MWHYSDMTAKPSIGKASSVLLRSTSGGRWLMYLGFAPILTAILITAMVSGARGGAAAVAMDTVIWLTIVRLVNREVEFGPDGIRYRADIRETWYPSEVVRHLAILDGGRKFTIWMYDESVRIGGISDFYYGPGKAKRRTAVRDRVAKTVDAEYARASTSGFPISPLPLGETRLSPTWKIAPLNTTEWVWLSLWVTVIALFLIFGS